MKNNVLTLNKNCDHNKLIEYGFYKYGDKYVLKIPLYKYKKIPTIGMVVIAEISDNKHYISYEILCSSNGSIYLPYYNNEFSKNNLVLRKVKRKINLKLKKLKENEIIDTQNKSKR